MWWWRVRVIRDAWYDGHPFQEFYRNIFENFPLQSCNHGDSADGQAPAFPCVPQVLGSRSVMCEFSDKPYLMVGCYMSYSLTPSIPFNNAYQIPLYSQINAFKEFR